MLRPHTRTPVVLARCRAYCELCSPRLCLTTNPKRTTTTASSDLVLTHYCLASNRYLLPSRALQTRSCKLKRMDVRAQRKVEHRTPHLIRKCSSHRLQATTEFSYLRNENSQTLAVCIYTKSPIPTSREIFNTRASDRAQSDGQLRLANASLFCRGSYETDRWAQAHPITHLDSADSIRSIVTPSIALATTSRSATGPCRWNVRCVWDMAWPGSRAAAGEDVSSS